MNKDIGKTLEHLKTILDMAHREIEAIEATIKFQNQVEEWITLKEAASICRIDRSTLNRYALTGRCEAKKVGSQWRFPKSRVEDMSFIKEVS